MQIGVKTSRTVDNKRVFVVDSDEITRAALQFILHDENETHELASLEQAFAKGRELRPDLIVLGIGVVRANGTNVLGEIAARFPGVKVLLVAELANDLLAKTCLGAGAHGLIAKPLTVESVRRKVDLLLGRRAPLAIPVEVA